MTAGTYNIVAEQGSTFTLQFTIDTDGTPWNLTSYTAAMQVRPFVESTTKILDLTSSNGITLGGSNGTVTVSVSAAGMTAAAAGRHVYDLELTSPGGVVTKIIAGAFIIQPEVTRDDN
jgi:hypothetical protein